MDTGMEPDSTFIYEMQILVSHKMLADSPEINFWSEKKINKGREGDKIHSWILSAAVSWCKFGRIWLQI